MKKILANSKEGMILYIPNTGTTIRFDRKETEVLFKVKPANDYHCELMHINITGRCNKLCEYCYVQQKHYDMPFHDFKILVDKAVDAGVFQITLGGGEPLLHPEINKFMEYASPKINVCTTTNGSVRISPRIVRMFRQVNVSYHENYEELEEALRWLELNDVRRGINFVYNKNTVPYLPNVTQFASNFGAEILLLQYKPIREQDWNLYINPEETFNVARKLADHDYKIAIDGACALKCMQKRRFITVDLGGEVYPCSFIHEPSMGNLLTQSFNHIWKNRGDVIICPYMTDEDKQKLIAGCSLL
jgi:MoaA/NifB/PqqE/SkfB family radical SAM enzyme